MKGSLNLYVLNHRNFNCIIGSTFTVMSAFYIVAELAQGGSVTNRATSASLDCSQNK